MYTSKLDVNMKAEIFIGDTTFPTSITKIIDDTTIELDAPISSNSEYVKLKTGTKYEIRFFLKSRIIKSCFTAIKFIKKGNILFLVIKLEKEVKDIQRREHVRFYCDIPFEIIIIDPQSVYWLNTTNETITGNIKDLSAGGFKFYSNTQLNLNTKIGCKISLEKESIFQLAEILFEDKLKDSTFKYSYSATFIGITEKERDTISRYIFNKQLSRRRTGK